jgi:endoglucanase
MRSSFSSRSSPSRSERRLLFSVLLGSYLSLACSPSAPLGSLETATKPGNVSARDENGPSDDMPLADAPTPPKASDNPLSGKSLWVDPDSLATLRARALERIDPDAAQLIATRIAKHPQAMWLGEWNSNVYRAVRYVVDRAARHHKLPIFVSYNLPGRDCDGFSKREAIGQAEYRRWVRKIAAGIGDREAVVVVEPDALGLLESKDCLTQAQQKERLFLLHDAIKVLRQNPGTIVYLDGGHSSWHPVNVHARLLTMAGVQDAHGFALNTSNYRALDELLAFGTELSALLDGSHFVIDTSRNGAGPYGVEWCNPPGRRLGVAPTTRTNHPLVDAFLWLKRPGESDGECNGGPRAGAFWDRAALDLAR